MARFLQVFLTTLLTLGLVLIALPALFQFLDVPSFRLGDGLLLVLAWRNDAQGSGVRFGVVPLAMVAVALALLDRGMARGDRPQ
jgi:hypothetical protein